MTTEEAAGLIRGAVLRDDGAPVGLRWADLGSGSGTFTFALVQLLGPHGHVLAVDREQAALDALRRGIRQRDRDGPAAEVSAVLGDFTDPDLPALPARSLDGVLFANALHFDPDPARTLQAVARSVRAGGRMAVVEYRDRPPNPWVPHPLPVAGLREAAAEAGLGEPRVVGERPSSYGGHLYCAWMAVP